MTTPFPLRPIAAGAIVSTVVLTGFTAPAHAQERPLLVERATVLPAGEAAVFGHLAYEIGREAGGGPGPDAPGGAKYDNARVGPFGARFGLGDRVEVGGYLTANINDEDDDGAPDNSGLEGLTVYGKIAANDYIAVTTGLTVAGSNDVGPYPNDGLDFFVNVPMQRPLGVGLLYGELGYTVQDNDIGGTFLNYGIGYAVPMNEQLSLNAELVGEESNTFARNGNTMSLVLGGNFQPDRNMDVAPYVSLGLYDAAPSLALGASFELRM